MASVRTAKQEQAQMMLEISLGEKRVSLGDLHEDDANNFLTQTLEQADLRGLRGFKPLRDLLTFRPGSFLFGGAEPHTLDVNVLDLSPEVLFEVRALTSEAVFIDLDSHFIKVCRGYTNLATTYKRHETNEKTSDWSTAHSWGVSAYNFKGSGAVLAIKRPRNHTGAHQNLFSINFCYEKVPLERKHTITKIEVISISIDDMRKFFGPSYSRIAVEFIWELRDIHSRTESELESQLNEIRRKVAYFERRSSSLSYT